MIKSTLSILFFILIVSPLSKADTPEHDKQLSEYKKAIGELKSAKSIECYFPQGTFANWTGQSMKLVEDHMSDAIHFDNIDTTNKNQARMIGNLGATDVKAFMSPTGVTFIESTDIGNFIYTTIYPTYLGNKKINSEPSKNTFLFENSYIAVTSRHGYHPFLGASSSQFHGYCRIME